MTTDRPEGPVHISTETEIGRLVVEQRLATQEEVSQCAQLADRDSSRSLAQVLVDEGVVTERQIYRVKDAIEDTRSQQIPGYQLLKRIGSGAMASVYMARQLSLDRVVAVKVLSRRLSENAEYVERFYKEGKAAARLNHPNIVQAIDVGEAAGFHYFVMEYVEGHTLYDELARGEVFQEEEALRIAIQIAMALEHAHGQGLIHRDVKPKNIMITKDGSAKLADMGLAREATDVQAAQAEAGRAFGTPYYISPEQIRGELDIDFRADIYSLGATLYHMVTGQVPFEGPTPTSVMHKHLKESLVPPDHLYTSLSAGVGEVVEVMMAKEPERRYSSTSDLLMDLRAIAAGQPPLLARRQIDAGVLNSLASGGDPDEATAVQEGQAQPAKTSSLTYLLVAVSLALNVLLLLLLVLS